MNEQHLALNNLQWLICHKTKPIKCWTKLFCISYNTLEKDMYPTILP